MNDTPFSIRPEDMLHTKNTDRQNAINTKDDAADNNINFFTRLSHRLMTVFHVGSPVMLQRMKPKSESLPFQ